MIYYSLSLGFILRHSAKKLRHGPLCTCPPLFNWYFLSQVPILCVMVFILCCGLFNDIVALGLDNLTNQVIPFDKDQVTLVTCRKNGHDLINKCIKTPPVTPEQVEMCTSLKTTYITCLALLNGGAPLEASTAKDSFYLMPDVPNPFSPCIFRTGHLIMWDVCENE